MQHLGRLDLGQCPVQHFGMRDLEQRPVQHLGRLDLGQRPGLTQTSASVARQRAAVQLAATCSHMHPHTVQSCCRGAGIPPLRLTAGMRSLMVSAQEPVRRTVRCGLTVPLKLPCCSVLGCTRAARGAPSWFARLLCVCVRMCACVCVCVRVRVWNAQPPRLAKPLCAPPLHTAAVCHTAASCARSCARLPCVLPALQLPCVPWSPAAAQSTPAAPCALLVQPPCLTWLRHARRTPHCCTPQARVLLCRACLPVAACAPLHTRLRAHKTPRRCPTPTAGTAAAARPQRVWHPPGASASARGG